MKDYLVWLEYAGSRGISSQTTRVELTLAQKQALLGILEGLQDSGDLLAFFLDEIPSHAATIRQFTNLTHEPIKAALKEQLAYMRQYTE